MTALPHLSVVMPVRDEAGFIEASVGAVLAQQYDGPLEVVVADGGSSDGTREALDRLAAGDARLRVCDNPEGIVATGLNRALDLVVGDLVMRVDGHCEIDPGYAARCVRTLLDRDVDCVGGVLRTVGATAQARGVALAQQSSVGVGNARFRTGVDRVRAVDTVAFGVYRRATFDRIGRFDPDLVRNQDDELNLRLVQSGGTILIDPRATAVYHSRATVRGAARQYWQYGWFKALVLRKRGRLPTVRSAVPSLFVLGLVVATLAGALLGGPVPALAPIALYATVLCVAAAWLGRRDPPAMPFVAPALAALHVPYGIGFLGGLWRWRRAAATPSGP